MIDLRPDPAHPRGGYAELSFDASALTGAETTVEVFDLYAERFLGQKGWQPERFAFGPYPVVHDGDRGRLILGPEIVDKIEEFAAVRLSLGTLVAELSWPDDIVHSPKAATSDTAIKVGDAPGPGPIASPIRMPDPDAEPVQSDPPVLSEPTEPDTPEPPEPAPPGPEPEDKKSSKLPLILGAAAVLAIAVAVVLFLPASEEEVVTPPPPPTPAPAAVVEAPDPCGAEALGSLAGQGFASIETTLRGCGAAVSADAALGLLEGAIAADDPAALAFFGTLYDAAQTDPLIEEQIGLTFGDDPARAAEYYARAQTAGAPGAEALLTSVCMTLMLKTDTLSMSARDDYCSN